MILRDKKYYVKIRPMGAELFHADRRDVTRLRVAFRNFSDAPKNQSDFSVLPLAGVQTHAVPLPTLGL